jgi:hypothetical protein
MKVRIAPPAYCLVIEEWMEKDLSDLREWGMGDSIQNPSLISPTMLVKGVHVLVNVGRVNQRTRRGENGWESRRGSL